MTTINESIATGTDDGRSFYRIPGGSGVQQFLSSVYLTVGTSNNATDYRFIVGTRFQTINIPQGTVITSATLTIKQRTASVGSPSAKIYGHDVDDAASTWGTANRIKDITKTTASVNMDVTGTSTNNVTTIVQEIVDRAGWVANNNMAFGLFGQVVGAGGNNWYGYAFEKGAPNIPTLDIVYGGAAAARTSDFFAFF